MRARDTTMAMNRRNVLIGLGAIAAGGGATFGSGAFSSVEAERNVNISATGDGSALLQIELTGDLSGSNGDTIAFELGTDVNLDAVTRFDGALTITNNGSNQTTIDILESSGGSSMIVANGGATDMNFEVASDTNNDGTIDASDLTLGSGDSVAFDVVFDLQGTTTAGNEDIPGTIVIEAT